MTLSYLPVRFSFRFAAPVHADIRPAFALRSVLGWQLRSLCCITHASRCPDCLYRRTCAYAFLFETILPQDNAVMPGRTRASHPFAITRQDSSGQERLTDYACTLTLFGAAVQFLPYIYAAFVRAGQRGLFRERVPFTITAVESGGQNLLRDAGHLSAPPPAQEWRTASAGAARKGEVLVELLTPLRFKAGGRYGTDFTAQDFMGCLFRRARTLCGLYGASAGEEQYAPDDALRIASRSLRWQEGRHYSARQKEAMSLGGASGTFRLCGTFTPFEQALLDGARICGAGKNTNFGLGNVDFWARWESTRG